MKVQLVTLAVLAVSGLPCASAKEAPLSKNSRPTVEKLFIAPCTTSVPLGKISLRVGNLVRRGGGYSGEYQVKVSPLFFAGEQGRLSMTCPDESLRKLAEGAAVEFVGQATTNGSGKTRPVIGRATPTGSGRGKIALWFTADNTKLAFTTTYEFAER